MPLIDSRPGDLAAARRRLDEVFVRSGEIRRTRAAIGVGVLCVILVAAFAVVRVLPSGSSAALPKPASGSAGPVPFPVGAVAAVGPQQWWVLGTRNSCAGGALCVAHTTDGAHYVQVPGPRAPYGTGATDAVARLAFQPDGVHGYAWGPGLWVTANGGATWAQVAGVNVVDLQAGASMAYLLVKSCSSSSSCPVSIDSLTTSTNAAPQLAPVPAPPAGRGSSPSAIAVNGVNAWAAYNNGSIVVLGSTTGGSLPARCPGGAPSALVDLDPDHFVALCPSGGSYRAYQLTEAGNPGARQLGLRAASPTSPVLASQSAVCVGDAGGGLTCTGGQDFDPTAPGQVVDVDAAGGSLFAVVTGTPAGSLVRAVAGQAWVAVPIGQ